MLTIVVDSFDGYSDLWPCFFDVFKKHWGDCPYNVKLVTNHKTYDGVETIQVGDEICWSERTKKAVEQVETEYILLLLEDYLFGEVINNDSIVKIFDFITSNKINYLRLMNIPKSRFSDEEVYSLYADEEYAINLQAAIWKKEFLIESLNRYPGSAWDFEIGFLRAAVNAEHKVIDGCFGLAKDPLHIRNGVLKGKWFPNEIKYFAKLGINISWKERGKLSIVSLLIYKFRIWIRDRISYETRKRLKIFFMKIGMKFASDL